MKEGDRRTEPVPVSFFFCLIILPFILDLFLLFSRLLTFTGLFFFPSLRIFAGLFLLAVLCFCRLIFPGLLSPAYYPFTAPDDNPEMMYFWNTRAMTTGGRDASTPAVLVRMKSLPNLLENSVIRTGSVFEASVEVKFSA